MLMDDQGLIISAGRKRRIPEETEKNAAAAGFPITKKAI